MSPEESTSASATGWGSAGPVLRFFVVTRILVGLVSWLSPKLSARSFGLSPGGPPIAVQLFGAREVAIGVVTATTTGESRAQALRVGIAIDVADAVASANQIRLGAFSNQAKLLTAAGAVTFAAIGA